MKLKNRLWLWWNKKRLDATFSEIVRLMQRDRFWSDVKHSKPPKLGDRRTNSDGSISTYVYYVGKCCDFESEIFHNERLNFYKPKKRKRGKK